jgi:hypothetical protein
MLVRWSLRSMAMEFGAQTYAGILLVESLQTDAVMEGVPLKVTKTYRAAVGDTNAGQPKDWTFIEFSISAETFADALSQALKKEGVVLRLSLRIRGLRGLSRSGIPVPQRGSERASRSRATRPVALRARGANRLA